MTEFTDYTFHAKSGTPVPRKEVESCEKIYFTQAAANLISTSDAYPFGIEKKIVGQGNRSVSKNEKSNVEREMNVNFEMVMRENRNYNVLAVCVYSGFYKIGSWTVQRVGKSRTYKWIDMRESLGYGRLQRCVSIQRQISFIRLSREQSRRHDQVAHVGGFTTRGPPNKKVRLCKLCFWEG
ncbi:hypothetical protein WN51_12897 [Melipona quadrifasciata]|uniref:Uncharacterized protein n=1 Tax=Melipona quadrifasciata TaxID=166423 RepID=A0A0M9A3H0_9HYME|nr:hypothetical protein WN51_12897 [Melipona quadrifasciata]